MTRTIPLTDVTIRLVEELLARQNSKYLVTMENGSVFNEARFRETVWKKILVEAEVGYEVPYSLRHTYFGWSLLVGIDPNILCGIGGHASRRTLYDHYGWYVEGVEEQKDEILNYLGADYVGKRGRL